MKNLLFVLFIGILFTQCVKTDKEKIEEAVRAINTMNFYSPGKKMRIDGAEYVPEKTIRIKLTLLQDIEDDEKDFYANVLNDAMKTLYIGLIKSNEDFKTLKDIGVTFIIQLKSQNDIELFNINITPEEYNKVGSSNELSLTGSFDDDVDKILQVVVTSIKKELPISFSDDDDVLLSDCEVSGRDLVYTFLLKDSFLEILNTEEAKDSYTKSLTIGMKGMISSNSSLKKLIESGVVAKFILKREDGSVYADFDIDKDNLE